MKKTLIIGYGNTLRSDDGVGVWIADRIAALDLPDVEVRTYHQLDLELIPDLLPFDTVILVDAAASGEPITYRVFSSSTAVPSIVTHNVNPESLQQLAHEFYGITLDMHLITVRGESFEFGSMLSPSVQQRAVGAINKITQLLHQSARNETQAGYATI
jgi:hydrogenase maturation protease